MGSISSYAALNARIRALKGKLLSPEEKNNLSKAVSLDDFSNIIDYTNYKTVVPFAHISEIEKKLNLVKINIIKKLYKQATGIVKDFIECRLEKIEIENIKIFLRLWRSQMDLSEYSYHIINEPILHNINYTKLIQSGTIEDIALKLKKTPYEKSIINGADFYNRFHSLFKVEFMLDKNYYSRLLSVIKQFSTNEKKILDDIICRQIDYENIINLFRYKKFYNLPVDKINDLILPGGNITKNESFINSYKEETLFTLLNKIFPEKISQLISNKIDNLDDNAFINFLNELNNKILSDKIKKLLSGYPFSIGTVLSYFFLLDKDIHFLISTTNIMIIKQITGRQDNASTR